MSTLRNVSYSTLAGIKLPEATKSYVPVGHTQLIDRVKEELDKLGHVNGYIENYRTDEKGQKLVGTITPLYDTGLPFNPTIVLRNSYDKSMSVGFAAGLLVRVCTNGMIIVEDGVRLVHKHTTNVIPEIEWKLKEAMGYLEQNMEKGEKQMNKMQEVEVNKRLASELAGRLFIEEDIVTSTQLSIIKKEIDFSEHFKDSNLWCFYNHVTEALKQQSSPINYIPQHLKLHHFVEKEFAI